jgi:hypothetical protein
MIPFLPTLDRLWESVVCLRLERRDLEGYVIHMGPALWADTARDARLHWNTAVNPNAMTIFGLPVEIDPSMKRGWISVRHEVVA